MGKFDFNGCPHWKVGDQIVIHMMSKKQLQIRIQQVEAQRVAYTDGKTRISLFPKFESG